MTLIERLYESNDLKKLAANLLINEGINKKDALIVAKVLVKAELEGTSSHGLTRLPIYIERINKGLINKKPRITTNFMLPALGIVDADNALGHVAGYKAMKAALERGKTFGVAIVGVKGSNHFGSASYYSDMAVKKGMIGLVISNGPPAIPVWGGREPYLGTNPLAVSIPGGELGPVVVDMSTSIVARGKIIRSAQEGKTLEPGWALDKEGKPTTDAKSALEGSILPMGGHKGSSIALLIELMAGLITGAGYGKQVAWQYSDTSSSGNVGHLFCAINPEGFMSKEGLGHKMDSFIKEIKELPKAHNVDEIRIPGERKIKNYSINKNDGIKLNESLIIKLGELAIRANLQMPISIK